MSEGHTERLYYVMPFIDGETLGDKIERERQLGVDEAVRIAHRNGQSTGVTDDYPELPGFDDNCIDNLSHLN